MRRVTNYEIESIGSGYSENPNPTQAVTIEWQFRNRTGGGSYIPLADYDYRWEEMVFPSEVVTIEGAPTLKIAAQYLDNPITFTSSDSPETYITWGLKDVYGNNPVYTNIAVTGQQKMFLDIANSTAWWWPESDAIDPSPAKWGAGNDRGFATRFQNQIAAQIWARRIKHYTFGVDGNITDIQHYVMAEKIYAGWGSPAPDVGTGVVDVTRSGGFYYIPLLTQTNNGHTAVFGIDTSGDYTRESAESILPLMEDGEPYNLLTNAQEASEALRQVTKGGGQAQDDVYADRQRARENLAAALWG